MLGSAVMFTYIGLSAGDVLSGLLSQLLKSRKKVIYGYLFFSIVLLLYYLNTPVQSFTQFKLSCLLLGMGTGYWALFVQVAAENFGTNIRSTVTNTVPNFVRFSVVPITLSFKFLSESMSVQNAALLVGSVCMGVALLSLYLMKETFSKDLNYHELD
jgi:sugar phosphate permease